jgi:Caspase domain
MLRAVLAAVLVLLGTPAAEAQSRVALLIGNQGYNARVGPLKNPHNDIALVGAALERLGFKVTLLKDADYRSIDAAIKRHVQSVRREGQGVISFVYYSGHGAADPDTKINYLIPVDVINADDEELWNYSLNLNTLIEGLRAQAPGATHYVVFDACRNELNLTRKGQKALSDKGFVPIAYTPGVMVAYATAPGRTASDVGAGGGTYAKALAEEIVKPGVDSMLVFTRVARRVQREIGQDPFLSASTMPEVYFAGNSSQPQIPGPALPTPQDATSNEVATAWATVKDSDNIAVLEAFIARYRSTFYADVARLRIEELKRQQQQAAVPSPPTPSGGDWLELGCQQFSLANDRGSVVLGRRAARFKSVRLHIRGSDMEVLDARLVFADGGRQDFAVRQAVRSGERSRPLSVAGGERSIERLEMVYRSVTSHSGGLVAVCVEGAR